LIEEAYDIKTLTIDIGVIGTPGFTPDIDNGEAAIQKQATNFKSLRLRP